MRSRLAAALIAALSCFATAAAHANGRLPAATGLAIHPTHSGELLLGLTYGLALTRDGGASWTWVCEQQIEGNGGDVDPAIVMTGDGTLVVLSLTNGGVLVSRDNGCTFERATGPLERNRGADLTLDPSQPSHVLAVTTILDTTTDAENPSYQSRVVHSLDNGTSWAVLSALPADLLPETLEVAPSDPKRIYVTGTARSDPLEGIVERSDDGGLSWKRTTVELPRSSGSLYISAIHPSDPDRLWVRVPRRGDAGGVLPTKLWLSMDGGASFQQVGDTQGGMLGFALSPDGERVAFGGPLDGLFVAPSNASQAPTKVSDMRVTCLRWRENALYACAIEPDTPFGLGMAADPTQGFVSLWHRANTCRASCAPPSRVEMKCQAPWEQLAPVLNAQTAICGTQPDEPMATSFDAGTDAGAPKRDGGTVPVVEGSPGTAGARPASGCTVSSPGNSTSGWLAFVVMLAGLLRRAHGSRPRYFRSSGPTSRWVATNKRCAERKSWK